MDSQHDYSLMCAGTLGEISPAEHAWWHHIARDPDRRIDECWETLPGEQHTRHLRRFARNLSNTAHDAIVRLDPRSPQQTALAALDLIYAPTVIKEVVSIRDDGDYQAITERMMRSYGYSAGHFTITEPVQREAARRATWAWNAPVMIAPDRKTLPMKRQEGRIRSAFRRSFNLLCKVIGESMARAIIRLQPVDLVGKLFNYQVQITTASALLDGSGYSSVRLSVHTHGGDRLCDLCIYSTDGTTLDHVASVALHIRAGEELELLATGNAFNLNWDHPREVEFITGRPAPIPTLPLPAVPAYAEDLPMIPQFLLEKLEKERVPEATRRQRTWDLSRRMMTVGGAARLEAYNLMGRPALYGMPDELLLPA